LDSKLFSTLGGEPRIEVVAGGNDVALGERPHRAAPVREVRVGVQRQLPAA
jgi:hypothetical protein